LKELWSRYRSYIYGYVHLIIASGFIYILRCDSFSSVCPIKPSGTISESNYRSLSLIKHWLSRWIGWKIFWLLPVIASYWFLSDLCCQIRKTPMDGTCRLLSNPISSDASNWGVLAWNPVSFQTANSDDFLIPDVPESRRIGTDPKIGSDRFRLYESDRKVVNPISGYQRKTVDMIGIWWKVTDRIRLAVLHRNWNPSDRIRRTRFDLGSTKTEKQHTYIRSFHIEKTHL